MLIRTLFRWIARCSPQGEPVTAFDHKVTMAYRWPIDDLAGLAGKAGFIEVGRMLREPREEERFRRGHPLMHKGT